MSDNEKDLTVIDYSIKLQAENKALKESIENIEQLAKTYEDIGFDLTERLRKSEESRDELLKRLKSLYRVWPSYSAYGGTPEPHKPNLYKKAYKAIKKAEPL